MSLNPPHLPSPAATPDTPLAQTAPNGGEQSQQDLCLAIEKKLLNLTQDLYELEICAGDVVQGQEGRIPEFLRRINEGLLELENMSRGLTETVPRQVIENVDTYHNPHLYTKGSLSRATGENQYALGRVLGLESFRRQLHDALDKDFPQIPLPERRHHPISSAEPSQPSDENGTSESRVKDELPDGMSNHT